MKRKTEPLTPVIFKLDKGTNSPVAFFPRCPGTRNPLTLECYAHLGQHCSASEDYVRECKPATPEQSAPLLRELQHIGYRLTLRRRLSRADRIARALEASK